jgi:hypothetical protein
MCRRRSNIPRRFASYRSSFLAAAGNYSTSSPYYPAALTNVLAVSATNDASDAFASFSNYANWISVAAASNSGIGIAGVAWLNPIMPIVVWDTTHAGTYANIAVTHGEREESSVPR